MTKHNDLNMNKHDKTHLWVFRRRTPCINCTCMHKRRNLELFRGKTEALLKLCIHDTHTLIFKSEARANLYTLYDTSTVLLWFGGPALQQGKHSGRKKKSVACSIFKFLPPSENTLERIRTKTPWLHFQILATEQKHSGRDKAKTKTPWLFFQILATDQGRDKRTTKTHCHLLHFQILATDHQLVFVLLYAFVQCWNSVDLLNLSQFWRPWS